MCHFGVKLEAVNGEILVPHGSQRTGGCLGQRSEVGRDFADLIAVAHPDLGLGRHPGKELVGLDHLTASPAIFAGLCPADLTAEGVAGQLHPIADAKHGDAQLKDAGIAAGSPRLVDARRTA